jgi:hypothetical protein
MALLDRQQYEEMLHDIDLSVADLNEYRSHLPRLKTEAEFDAKELHELPDDVTKDISDWKMKILSAFFRENQGRFFGKRGTSLIGHMLIRNSEDADARAKGLKDVRFVFLVTDDGAQDEWEVICAKAFVFQHYVQTPKVLSQSDGAGCFSSKLNRIVTPFWEAWTGVVELENRISPRGGGKTGLDSGYGKMNHVQSNAVNAGASYWNAETYQAAFEMGGGLTATSLIVWECDRSNQFWGDFRNLSIESVLRTVFNPLDLSMRAYKHSDFGSGFKIRQSNMFCFDSVKDARRKMPKFKEPTGSVPMVSCVASHIRMYLGWSTKIQKSLVKILNKIKCPIYALNGVEVTKRRPRTIRNQKNRHNKKENFKSYKAPAGQGANHANQRAARKLTRMETKQQKQELAEVEESAKVRAAQLFWCECRCPKTGRRCKAKFRHKQYYNKHVHAGKHSFPSGVGALSELAYQASNPGGSLAVGSRPDRNSTSLFCKIVEASADTLGIDHAICYRKFNRKEDQPAYHKPDRLRAEMLRLFQIGQDGTSPMLNAGSMQNELKKMRDPKDGGLMFCYSKRGSYPRGQLCNLCKQKPCDCNGMMPPVWMCQQFINTQTQEKKKKDKGAKRTNPGTEEAKRTMIARMEEGAQGTD